MSPRRGKPEITCEDGFIRSSGSGKAGKTTLRLTRSEVRGEFMEITIERNDFDDQMQWHMHYSEKAATMFALWFMQALPPHAVLRLIAYALETRADVQEALEQAVAP